MYRNNHCRVCNHYHSYVWPSTIPGYDYDIGLCLYYNNGCKCIDNQFITSDNLEYLELKVTQKEKLCHTDAGNTVT